ncbi:disease resistance RPP13 3 [Chlorella sorokiniana]|uniref:Disease resistance RPP13 3 n=1 Tax=Chlorella sorokiniana TaxID=3076 RepID=A0A2P6TZW1_CHLSO|nr:disease resistance RPP13 3 [Chlorella sorokiniana]|eukprot:PRW59607.1 disease resistance RPP13 3 [Chlorella sorokiniana]
MIDFLRVYGMLLQGIEDLLGEGTPPYSEAISCKWDGLVEDRVRALEERHLRSVRDGNQDAQTEVVAYLICRARKELDRLSENEIECNNDTDYAGVAEEMLGLARGEGDEWIAADSDDSGSGSDGSSSESDGDEEEDEEGTVAFAALLLLSPQVYGTRLLRQDGNNTEHPKCPEGEAWDAVREECVVPPTPLISAAILAKVDGYPTCFEKESGIYDVSYAELWECDTGIWQPMVAGSDAQLTCSKACQLALSKVSQDCMEELVRWEEWWNSEGPGSFQPLPRIWKTAFELCGFL